MAAWQQEVERASALQRALDRNLVVELLSTAGIVASAACDGTGAAPLAGLPGIGRGGGLAGTTDTAAS